MAAAEARYSYGMSTTCWKKGRASRAAPAALALGLAAALGAYAEAPILAAKPKEARARVMDAALAELGAPYLYGGADDKGFDCSGLVYRAYADALGAALPRTARSLYSYAERIERGELQPGDLVFFDTTGRLAHVGLYLGEGRFVHAASEGPRVGVIESSLGEAYWARSYAGAGRILSPAEYLGLVLRAALGPSLGASPLARGAAGAAGLSFRALGLEFGLEARPEYDAALAAGRLPLVLTVGLDRSLRVFAGPALTLGSPRLEGSEGAAARAYHAEGGVLGTAGLTWTPLRFSAAGLDWGLYAELVYNRYVADEGQADDAMADLRARVRAGAGLSARFSF